MHKYFYTAKSEKLIVNLASGIFILPYSALITIIVIVFTSTVVVTKR